MTTPPPTPNLNHHQGHIWVQGISVDTVSLTQLSHTLCNNNTVVRSDSQLWLQVIFCFHPPELPGTRGRTTQETLRQTGQAVFASQRKRTDCNSKQTPRLRLKSGRPQTFDSVRVGARKTVQQYGSRDNKRATWTSPHSIKSPPCRSNRTWQTLKVPLTCYCQ